MTVREYLGLDSHDKDKDDVVMSHEDKYTKVVNALGYIAVKQCLPKPHSRILEALDNGDEHLNTIPLATWDSCTTNLSYKEFGLTSVSLSEKVCILKRCAKMMWEKSKQ
jgi:hypothetical protein